MNSFEIVAHRGVPDQAPENTMASFQRALELGADAVELDVRLTADRHPVVYHYFYLQENTSASGPVFGYTLEQLRDVEVYRGKGLPGVERIPTLEDVLETFGGKIGLEIELKGPEPEAPAMIGAVLHRYPHLWETIEVTSYEPALLLALQKVCPGINVDLLFPRSQSWMGPDVVAYSALHSARTAHARAVHLHPAQLSQAAAAVMREHGIEIHIWDANDRSALDAAVKYGIPRVCTDQFSQAYSFRESLAAGKPQTVSTDTKGDEHGAV